MRAPSVNLSLRPSLTCSSVNNSLWFPASNAYIVHNEVTDDHQVHDSLTGKNREHVLRHPLPEVHQKILHFMEVGPHNAVQDTLTVCAVHQQESLHLDQRRKKGRGNGKLM